MTAHDVDPLAWMRSGECLGADPDLFFPERGEPTEPAKEMCARCPVRATCLEYALANGEMHGIWGGMSERQRRVERRRRALCAAPPACASPPLAGESAPAARCGAPSSRPAP